VPRSAILYPAGSEAPTRRRLQVRGRGRDPGAEIDLVPVAIDRIVTELRPGDGSALAELRGAMLRLIRAEEVAVDSSSRLVLGFG
jgi:hypothetical protein